MISGQALSRGLRTIRPVLAALCLLALGTVHAADACDQYDELLDYGIVGESGFSYGNNSEINGNDISGNNGNTPTPTGQITTVDPDFPPFEPASFPSGGTNLSNVSTLSPGTYGSVTVPQNRVLTLAPGTYFINDLIIGNKVDVVIQPVGAVRLYVGRSIVAGNEVALNPDGAVGDLMIFLYSGASFIAGNGNQGSSDLNFNGILYSPYSNTTISFGNNNDIQGAVLSAGTVSVGNNTAFDYGEDVEQAVREALGCDEAPPIHHFDIQHDGQGLTCMAETITVRACADEACTAYTESVTLQIDASSPDGALPVWVGGNQATTTSGLATFTLRSSIAGSVSLGLSSTTHATAPVWCNGMAVTPCPISFEAVGLLFDGDDRDDGNAGSATRFQSPIPEQIAGKPSNTGYQAATQRLRVVRADQETGACETVLANTTVPARFHYTVPVASTGLTDNRISISGASNALTAAGSVQNIDLAFGTDGTAPFWFSSRDAGVHTLHVELPVSIDDDSDGNADRTLTLNTQRAFIARPLAVYVDTEPRSNPQAADASGGVFARAGEAFPLRFVALGWQDSADDSDANGEWDACASPTLSAGQPRARVPEWEIGTPQASLFAPAGGAPGSLTYPGGAARFAAGSDTLTLDSSGNRVSFSEAGIIRFDGNNLAFLTTAAQACSPRIGRFIPDRFEFDTVVLASACSGTFTYAGLTLPASSPKPGQVFDFSGRIRAVNTAGNLTANYSGTFSKLDAADLTFTPKHFDPAFTEPLYLHDAAPTAPSPFTFAGGVLNFVIRPQLRTETVLPPRQVYLAIEAEDSDAVQGSHDDPAVSKAFRHGRLAVMNAHQHLETADIALTLQAEYFNGTRFVVNPDDSCTALGGVAQFSLANNKEANQIDGTIAVGNGSSTLEDIGVPTPFAAGVLIPTPRLTAPGAGNAGFVDVRPRLDDAGLPWLRYDWNGDGAHDDNPTGRASWGLYRGNRNVIRTREIWR